MLLSQNIRATRIEGVLNVELEDGRIATLDVDLDVSSPATTWGVDHHYSEASDSVTISLGRLEATTFSVTIPAGAPGDGSAQFVLRIPIQ